MHHHCAHVILIIMNITRQHSVRSSFWPQSSNLFLAPATLVCVLMAENAYEAIYKMSRIDGHRFRNRAACGGIHPKAAPKARGKHVPSSKAPPAGSTRTSGIAPGRARRKRKAPAHSVVERAAAASGIVPTQLVKEKRMSYSCSERYELAMGGA